MTDFTIRPLLHSDLEWLRTLRNANRAKFFKTDEITPEQQLIWWKNQHSAERHYVIDVDGKHVGYFAFVRPNFVLPIFATTPLRGYTIYLNSLLLEPEYRGRGIMKSAVASRMSSNISYCGYVRVGNEPSLRTCLAVGLRNMGRFTHPDYGTMHVLWRG